jgi:hypothetical protein
MNRRVVSLRLLQLYSLGSATIAVLGGGAFVLGGIDGVARVVGTEYSALVPMLEQASASIDPEAGVTFSTWYRVLGWYWLVTGLMLFWITPKVQLRTDWFRFIHVAFMAVGVASLVTISQHGTNVHNRFGAVVFEIGIPSAAIVWQWFVARSPVESE